MGIVASSISLNTTPPLLCGFFWLRKKTFLCFRSFKAHYLYPAGPEREVGIKERRGIKAAACLSQRLQFVFSPSDGLS